MKDTYLGALLCLRTGIRTMSISTGSSFYFLEPHCSICLKHKIVERCCTHYLSRRNKITPSKIYELAALFAYHELYSRFYCLLHYIFERWELPYLDLFSIAFFYNRDPHPEKIYRCLYSH